VPELNRRFTLCDSIDLRIAAAKLLARTRHPNITMSVEVYFTAPSGTGTRVGRAAVIVAGVAALIATLTTCVSIWLQAYDLPSHILLRSLLTASRKNYRKPLLQRYVIRILLM
jgi:hypothetical protein